MSEQQRWDLHMHSTHSDGTFTPFELIDEAKRRHLTGIAITDHDTFSAYTEEVFTYSKKQGIGLLVGAEFSTVWQGVPVHILGYGFVLDHQGLTDLTKWHIKRRQERNQAILEALKSYGIEIDSTMLHGRAAQTIGRPHIAQLLVEKGIVSTVKEAFDQWIGDGKRAYVAGASVTPAETIDLIHRAGGAAILAHPILLKKRRWIRELLDTHNFDGMEGHYAAFLAHQNEEMVNLGKSRGLIITGGSDFHGFDKPFIKVGSSYTNEDEFEKLLQACQKWKK